MQHFGADRTSQMGAGVMGAIEGMGEQFKSDGETYGLLRLTGLTTVSLNRVVTDKIARMGTFFFYGISSLVVSNSVCRNYV